jgi:hypothetical protein
MGDNGGKRPHHIHTMETAIPSVGHFIDVRIAQQ